MPLHTQCETWRVGDSYGFYRAVLRHALNDNSIAWLANALTMERVDLDRFSTKEFRKNAARHKIDTMAIGENDLWIGMYLSRFQPRRPVVQSTGQISNLGVQGTAKRNIHFLETTTDAENRDTPFNTSFRQV